MVLKPGSGATLNPAYGYCVAGLFCYAFYNIFTRKVAASDSSRTTTLFSTVGGVVILTPFLPTFWQWPDSPLIWVLLAAVGIFGGVGHWLLVLAHGRAPAAILAPFVYTQLIWMVGLGFGVFGDVPGSSTIVGAAIVVLCGLYLVARERTVKKVRAAV